MIAIKSIRWAFVIALLAPAFAGAQGVSGEVEDIDPGGFPAPPKFMKATINYTTQYAYSIRNINLTVYQVVSGVETAVAWYGPATGPYLTPSSWYADFTTGSTGAYYTFKWTYDAKWTQSGAWDNGIQWVVGPRQHP